MFYSSTGGTSDNEEFFDADLKRVYKTNNLPADLAAKNDRSFCKFKRPDLSILENRRWARQNLRGEYFLMRLGARLNAQCRKLTACKTFYFKTDYFNNYLENARNALRDPVVKTATQNSTRSLHDLNQIAQYMQKVEQRIYKYGLQFPLLEPKLTKGQCEQLEEQAYQSMLAAVRPAQA